MPIIAMRRRRLLLAAFFAAALIAAAAPALRAEDADARRPPRQRVDAIYTNAVVHTMKEGSAPAEAIAVAKQRVVAVGTAADIRAKYTSLQVRNLQGATVLPGFIDSHSHMQGWGVYTDSANWLDLSNMNVLLKPLPGDPRCTAPTDPQNCFIPVQTQDDAIARLQQAVASAPTPTTPIQAFGYEAARLGHSSSCGANGNLAFACPNFENGLARQALDGIAPTNPLLIASQSGHIAYVNTAALTILNICGTDVATAECRAAIVPPFDLNQEGIMANLGQLNEDLAIYGIGQFVLQVFKKNPALIFSTFNRAVQAYAQNGFTFVQEGAASDAQVLIYMLSTALNRNFPVAAAMLYYDGSNDVAQQAEKARRLRARNANNQNLLIHGIKDFADGSTQGVTGFLEAPYANLFYPFTDPAIFPPAIYGNPFLGIPDTTQSALTADANAAHATDFPLAIHQNGDGAIAMTLAALQAAGTKSGLRDLMLHFSLASPQDLVTARNLGTGVTFLITNLYYYGLPLCQQVLGPTRTADIYPTGGAVSAGLRFGLHADSPVGPPVPLFMIWVAKTRKTQQPPWYPNADVTACPEVLGPGQRITIRQGVKALTTDAAYLYNLEHQYGTIQPGKYADLVILSADPLAMEDDPDSLRTVRVLGTVHHGAFHANPNADQPPIWPE